MDNRKELSLKYDESILNKIEQEQNQLESKILNLKGFLNKYKNANDEYSFEQFTVMSVQLEAMEKYNDALLYRIHSMKITQREADLKNGKDN